MFTIVATILFFVLASIWNKKSWIDLILKIGLWAMTIWGIFSVLQQLGYIVKA